MKSVAIWWRCSTSTTATADDGEVLVIPGSTQEAALSKRLAGSVARLAPDGVEVTVIDRADHSMPLYDGDLEEAEGLPAGAVSLRAVVKQHDALLFVSPE